MRYIDIHSHSIRIYESNYIQHIDIHRHSKHVCEGNYIQYIDKHRHSKHTGLQKNGRETKPL